MILTFLLVTPASAADGEWVQLRSAQAHASSFLRSNWNKYTENYHPSYVLDGDPKTAWVEGVDGNGVGETIEWSVSRVEKVHRVKLRIRNGYHKSDGLLTANAAPTALTVKLWSYGTVGASQTWSVKRQMGWQELVIDPPEDFAFDRVELVVDGALPGRTYEDLCISDVEVFVDASDTYNAPVENAKHQTVLAWVTERKADATYFANLPASYPFASTQYTPSSREMNPAERASFEADVSRLQIEADRLLAQPTWRAVAVAERVRPPEGLDVPEVLYPYFGSGVTFADTAQDWLPSTSSGDEIGSWQKENALTNVKQRVDGDRATLAFRQRTVIEERGVTTTNSRWLVETKGGRVQRAFISSLDDGGEGCDAWSNATIWTFTWSGEKVTSVDTIRRWGCTKTEEPPPYGEAEHNRTVYSAEGTG